MSGVGAALDAWHLTRQRKQKSTGQKGIGRGWALGMLIASYVLLIPGLVMVLGSFDISFSFFGMAMPLSSEHLSAVQVMEALFRSGSYFGSIFLLVWDMAVPAVKVSLLVLAMVCQHGSPAKVHLASQCIRIVRWLAKWAAMDVFAYIVMICLVRGFAKPPHLSSTMDVGLGFTCFGLFCLGTTFSSLGLRLPELRTDDGESSSTSAAPSRMGPMRFAAVVSLALAFMALLCGAVAVPCLEVRADMDLFYANNPDIAEMKVIVDTLGIPQLVHHKTSMLDCLTALSSAMLRGEANAGLAFVFLGCFAICIPLTDAVLMLLGAGGSYWGAAPDTVEVLTVASRLTRRLAMLDVCALGIAVVVLSLHSFLLTQGLVLSLHWGALAMFGAELCRHLMVLLVGRAQARPCAAAKEAPDLQPSNPQVPNEDVNSECEV